MIGSFYNYLSTYIPEQNFIYSADFSEWSTGFSRKPNAFFLANFLFVTKEVISNNNIKQIALFSILMRRVSIALTSGMHLLGGLGV